MDGWMDRWMDGWMDGWMDRWMDGWIDGWMDRWMGIGHHKVNVLRVDTHTHKYVIYNYTLLYLKCE